MNKKAYRKKQLRKKRIIYSLILLLILGALITGIVFAIAGIVKLVNRNDNNDTANSSVSDTSSQNKTDKVITATVINTGDILIHSTVLDGAKTPSGEYDFSEMFKSTEQYFKNADLAVANLEVTLGGLESGKFSGYPAFNTPDILAENLKNAGINFLLTANNHCYDTGLFGLKRTANVLDEKGIEYIGTRASTDKEFYTVKNVNGINIGMACYTYENTCATPGRKSINGNVINADANNLINSFSYENLPAFYADAQSTINAMKNKKADCIVFYMHWGEEYQLKENKWQREIAQKLADMGVDVIVGGHPHVIQPMEYLTSSDGKHHTACIYSMGNGVSNQRQELMSPECTTGHTEDGMLFSYTFTKYGNGKTELTAVDIIPTWVNKYKGGSGYLYQIYPLESPDGLMEKYGFNETANAKASASYIRTSAIISEGLTACQSALNCNVRYVSETIVDASK